MIQEAREELRRLIQEFKAQGRSDVHRLDQAISEKEENLRQSSLKRKRDRKPENQPGFYVGVWNPTGPFLLREAARPIRGKNRTGGREERRFGSVRCSMKSRRPPASSKLSVCGSKKRFPWWTKPSMRPFWEGCGSWKSSTGPGPGRLRKAVRDYLREHDFVENFGPGGPGRGGDGVTVVEVGPTARKGRPEDDPDGDRMKGGIPEEKIAEIKGKAHLVEVISDLVSLRKAGKNYLGLCPFHSERTPSFTVNEEKGIFHCFGCGVGRECVQLSDADAQLDVPGSRARAGQTLSRHAPGVGAVRGREAPPEPEGAPVRDQRSGRRILSRPPPFPEGRRGGKEILFRTGALRRNHPGTPLGLCALGLGFLGPLLPEKGNPPEPGRKFGAHHSSESRDRPCRTTESFRPLPPPGDFSHHPGGGTDRRLRRTNCG